MDEKVFDQDKRIQRERGMTTSAETKVDGGSVAICRVQGTSNFTASEETKSPCRGNASRNQRKGGGVAGNRLKDHQGEESIGLKPNERNGGSKLGGT